MDDTLLGSFVWCELMTTVDHEAVGGDVDHVQRHVAARQVFPDHRIIDRVPRSAALVVDRKLCSGHGREPPTASDREAFAKNTGQTVKTQALPR